EVAERLRVLPGDERRVEEDDRVVAAVEALHRLAELDPRAEPGVRGARPHAADVVPRPRQQARVRGQAVVAGRVRRGARPAGGAARQRPGLAAPDVDGDERPRDAEPDLPPARHLRASSSTRGHSSRATATSRGSAGRPPYTTSSKSTASRSNASLCT